MDLAFLELTLWRHELVSISTLLHDARTHVIDEVRLRSQKLIVIPVDDEVLVDRQYVQLVVVALLRDAVESTPSGGRIAITAQDIERELVVAIYDSGEPRTSNIDNVARDVAHTIGGRVWRTMQSEGNLVLFSVPLHSARLN